MITVNALRASLAHELGVLCRSALRVVFLAIVPVLFALFVVMDGIVVRNAENWSAGPRAMLVLALFAFGMMCLAWYKVRLTIVTCLVVGIGAALVISQSYHAPSRPDLTLWAILLASLLLQRVIKRDWSPDMARAGLAVAVVALIVSVGNSFGITVPNGTLNNNVLAGVIAALLPAAVAHAGGGDYKLMRVFGLMAMTASLLALGSRGGLLGAMVALIVLSGSATNMWRRPARAIAIIACLGVCGVLLTISGFNTMMGRLWIWQQAINQWINTSFIFGIGPGRLFIPLSGAAPVDQAHNALVTLAATTGIAGATAIGFALSNSKREWPRLKLWHWATLAALCAHAMVDDPFTWLPTVIIAGLVVGSAEA